jgi:hypothetical protein
VTRASDHYRNTHSLAAKSNLYATQGRSAANLHAKDALDCFHQDAKLTSDFNKIEGGKWKQHVIITPSGSQADIQHAMPDTHWLSVLANAGQEQHASHISRCDARGDIRTG